MFMHGESLEDSMCIYNEVGEREREREMGEREKPLCKRLIHLTQNTFIFKKKGGRGEEGWGVDTSVKFHA